MIEAKFNLDIVYDTASINPKFIISSHQLIHKHQLYAFELIDADTTTYEHDNSAGCPRGLIKMQFQILVVVRHR